jgi:Lrp/AsnC family leucine-responsive transcriptional regulator
MIDEFDAKILNLMQKNARLTAEAIAEKVGLSPSTVQKRQTRLRQDGIISAEIAVVSPRAVGQQLTMIIEVTVERERPELLDQFKRSVTAQAEVMQCFYVTGDKDFILVVNLRDMEHYEKFTTSFFKRNSNIRRVSTSVVVDPVKVGLAIPIAAST